MNYVGYIIGALLIVLLFLHIGRQMDASLQHPTSQILPEVRK